MVKIIEILVKLTYMDLNTFSAILHEQTIPFLNLLAIYFMEKKITLGTKICSKC